MHTDPPPEWKTLPSAHGTTPRQRDDNSCGIYQQMFMGRIANGRAAEAVGCGSIEAARRMIAAAIWNGTIPDSTQHRVHWSLLHVRTETNGDKDTSEVGEQNRNTDSEGGGTKNEEDDNPRSEGGMESSEDSHKKIGIALRLQTL